MKKRIATVVLSICLLSIARGQITPESLRAGDILYLDSGEGLNGAYAVRFNPDTGQQTVLASQLVSPGGIAVDQCRRLIVGSHSSILRLDLTTGAQEILADLKPFGLVWGLAVAADGDIFATYIGGRLIGHRRYSLLDYEGREPKFRLNSGVVRVNPVTGRVKSIASGQLFQYPIGIAVSENGDLFVSNIAFPGEIIRLKPKSGRQSVVSRGGHLHYPLGIAVNGQYAYVTDVGSEDENFGVGTVVRVDIGTGDQTVLSIGDNLLKPVGIAFDQSGQLVVADPYTINPESRNRFDGGVVRIDPETGAQTLLMRGYGNILNPLALTVVR